MVIGVKDDALAVAQGPGGEVAEESASTSFERLSTAFLVDGS
jgi:hypothetical protein